MDVTADKPLLVAQGSTADVNSVAFSPDGKTLVSGGADNAIRFWDVASGKGTKTLAGDGRAVNSVAYSPDGRTVATGGDDNTVKLWDAATGKLSSTLQGHTGPVLSVAFSREGHMLASGSADTTVRLWDLSGAPALYSTLQGHSAAVQSVAFSRDGAMVTSGSETGRCESGIFRRRRARLRGGRNVGLEGCTGRRSACFPNLKGRTCDARGLGGTHIDAKMSARLLFVELQREHPKQRQCAMECRDSLNGSMQTALCLDAPDVET